MIKKRERANMSNPIWLASRILPKAVYFQFYLIFPFSKYHFQIQCARINYFSLKLFFFYFSFINQLNIKKNTLNEKINNFRGGYKYLATKAFIFILKRFKKKNIKTKTKSMRKPQQQNSNERHSVKRKATTTTTI